jgi:hypothetical protein
MKTLQVMLAAALMAANGSAMAAGFPGHGGWGQGDPPGWSQVNPGQGGTMSAELDPVDAAARAFPGADGTGFGEWADSDAGAQQPGQGAPWSGIRPPK